MILVNTFGCAVEGIQATLVRVEVKVGRGEFGVVIVGLPDNAIRESWARIFTAFRQNDYEVPRGKTIVNMAPVDIRKEGAAYDLTIALGMLASNGSIQTDQLSEYVIMGELSLDGTVRPIKASRIFEPSRHSLEYYFPLFPSE